MKTLEAFAYHAAPLCGLHLRVQCGIIRAPYLSEDKNVLLQKAAAVAFGVLGGGIVASFDSYWSSAAVATLVGGVDALYQSRARELDLQAPESGFFRMFALTQLITTTKLSNRFAGMAIPAITPLMAIWASYRRHPGLSQ